MFVVVNGDEDNARVFKEVFGQTQVLVHEGEPLGVAVAVFAVYEVVVVFKVFNCQCCKAGLYR